MRLFRLIKLVLSTFTLTLVAGFLSGCEQTSNADFWASPGGTDEAVAEFTRLRSEQTDGQPGSTLQRQLVLCLNMESVDAPTLAKEVLLQFHNLDEVGPILAEGLRHSRANVRTNTAKVIGLTRIRGFETYLRRATSDREESVRVAAIRTLGALQDKGSRFLMLLALKDGSWKVRGEAADAVQSLMDPSVIKYLLRAMPDRDDYVQMQLATTVLHLAGQSKIDPSSVTKVLQKALNPDNPSRSLVAALALAEMNNTEGLSLLTSSLRSTEPWRERELVEAIAGLSPETASTLFPELLAQNNSVLDPATLERMKELLTAKPPAKE